MDADNVSLPVCVPECSGGNRGLRQHLGSTDALSAFSSEEDKGSIRRAIVTPLLVSVGLNLFMYAYNYLSHG